MIPILIAAGLVLTSAWQWWTAAPAPSASTLWLDRVVLYCLFLDVLVERMGLNEAKDVLARKREGVEK